MRRPRLGIAVVVLSLLLALPGSAPAAPADDCSRPYAETFHITADARRKSYRIGQTALVDVRVTDKLTGQPEDGVNTGVFVQGRRDKVVFGVSKTDGDGSALLHLRLKRSATRPGWARGTAVASEAMDTPVYCTGRYGDRTYKRLFFIRAQ